MAQDNKTLVKELDFLLVSPLLLFIENVLPYSIRVLEFKDHYLT